MGYAQGGVAAVTDQSDSFQSHVEDTLIAGADLCDRPIVKQVVEHAPQRIAELQQWGMNFDMDGDKPALGREGGHSAHRILHSDGDATGMELSPTLDCKIRET